MDSKLPNPRRKLAFAIASGKLDRSDTLDDRTHALAQLFDCDSLDLVELIMALEKRSKGRIQTLGDLLDSFPDNGPDSDPSQ
jgi:acyl carrier protein